MIGVVGCGKVGFAHLRWLLSRGQDAIGFDTSPLVQNKIIDELGPRCLAENWNDLAVCSAIHICVPTDPSPDGSADLSIIQTVIEKLAELERGGGAFDVIVQRSTCPPGTADKLAKNFRHTSYGVN